MPACYDALSAKLVERAGFKASFMSGFSVAGARLGMPDTGLISYGEMLDQGRNICGAVSIPVIASGGAGRLEHLAEAIEAGAHGVLAATIFHFRGSSLPEARAFLRSRGYPVRP